MCHGCGYGYSWIGVWKSNDLSEGSWELLGDARPDDGSWPQQNAVQAYFRVHTIYNQKTRKYVMWVNVDNCPAHAAGANPSGACYAVGTSSAPEGPFDYVGATTARYPSAGDFDLLVDDDGRGYVIYTSTSTGHVMSVELLNEDFTRTLAAGPAPPPTPAPAPPAPLPGFELLGSGACRDSTGVEPPFFTDEHDAALKASMAGNQSACAATCAADTACTAFSWCDGAGAGRTCNGACHVYMDSSATPPSVPTAMGWSWTASAGNAGDVSKITTGEAWWRCQRKATMAPVITTNKRPRARKEESIAARALQAADMEPTNTSSGIFGNHFVEGAGITRSCSLVAICSVTSSKARASSILTFCRSAALSFCRSFSARHFQKDGRVLRTVW